VPNIFYSLSHVFQTTAVEFKGQQSATIAKERLLSFLPGNLLLEFLDLCLAIASWIGVCGKEAGD